MTLTSYLCTMQAIQNLARVRSQSRQDFRTGATHAHETDRRFRIRLCLVLEYEVDAVCLCFPSGGDIVSITTALAVVHPKES